MPIEKSCLFRFRAFLCLTEVFLSVSYIKNFEMTQIEVEFQFYRYIYLYTSKAIP